MSAALAGIFVGGGGQRMGGVAKGLLRAPGGGTLLERWRRVLDEARLDVVLVGRADAYGAHRLEVLEDDPPGIGPLGGLSALLARAAPGPAIAVACDMPYVSVALVRRLLAAPDAPLVAPRRDGRWEPMLARYEPATVLPVARAHAASGRHALRDLFDAVGASELPLTIDEARELRDWDRPEDVTAG